MPQGPTISGRPMRLLDTNTTAGADGATTEAESIKFLHPTNDVLNSTFHTNRPGQLNICHAHCYTLGYHQNGPFWDSRTDMKQRFVAPAMPTTKY